MGFYDGSWRVGIKESFKCKIDSNQSFTAHLKQVIRLSAYDWHKSVLKGPSVLILR